MDAKKWQQVKALLQSALELAPEQWTGFLEENCPADAAMRDAVTSLLEAHADAKSFLETRPQPNESVASTVTDPTPAGASTPSTQIGPYRILEQLGEGGMGAVYLAEQTEPVRRRVALKIIKHGMDTKQVIARFEAERQALAMMDHPCVAKVFDAGSTEGGRPYFAMEYVQGVPITAHCDRQRLTTRERLELFQQVCDGVQHAHQKAIIHRDLKPSNVLVSYRDGKATPKIIDFGVAKAIEHRLTEKTLYTEMGVLIGTPEYMSPEQAEMTGQNVDTRTDVYSLGVMLYELLVGALPFDSRELREAGFDEIRRRIREDEPSKPSTRLSTLDGERSTESAKRRKTDPSTLRRLLSGDLDWITMRALEKDRARRYGSPNELAADIGRHLKHEPVLASPPSTIYRATRFVRRHRIGVAVAVAAFLLLVAFAVRERIQANRIAREAATAEQVSEFLVGLFEVSDPSEARGKSITAREILDKGAKEIDGTLADQPELQARLMTTMGDVYRKLGLYSQGETLLEQALETRRGLYGDDHPDTLRSMNSLADLYLEQGRYDEAEPLYLVTIETRKRVLGDDHPGTLSSMGNLALLLFRQGRYDEAEPLYLDTIEIQKRVLGDDHASTLGSMGNMASLYLDQGRYDEAEPLYLETLETQKRVLGDDHPDTLISMGNLANLYVDQGRYDEAEPLYLETLEIQKRVLGDDHPDTLISMGNLANLYNDQGRYDEAEPLYLETLETQKSVLGDDHPYRLTSTNNLANLYREQGRYDEAEPFYLETLETQERVLGDEHLNTLITVHNLACLYRDTDRLDEAGRGFERVQRFCDAKLRPEHGFSLANLDEHAKLLRRTGDDDGADRMEARAKAIREKQ